MALSFSERLMYQVVVLCTLLTVYMVGFFRVTHQKYQYSKNMLHRKQDRLEKRASFDPSKISQANPKTIQNKIDAIEEELQQASLMFDELDTGFAPVDSSEVLQQLMLEISTLAERTGVILISVSRKGFNAEDGSEVVPLDPQLGRPLLVVTANTEFGPLLDFLDGLKELSFYVSVMNLKVYSLQAQGSSDKSIPSTPGGLFVSLEVSM